MSSASEPAALLFAYGTLKRGLSNHSFLAGQRFLGEAVTAPVYRLDLLDGYPGMVDSPNGVAIEGEVWRVDRSCLEGLDTLEGTAEGLYARRPVRLSGSFEKDPVETYVYLRDITGRPELGSRFA